MRWLTHNRTVMHYLQKFHVRLLLALGLFFYIIVPLLVWLNPSIVNIFIFGNKFIFPFSDLAHPVSYGLEGVRNFRLTTDEGIELGIWHLLPVSLYKAQAIGNEAFEQTLASGKEIIIYCHGKGQNRGSKIRVGIYKALTQMGFHVITFDYRGYGDSTGIPTEDGMVSDALSVYTWIRQRSQTSPVFIWGHSLGTGVATKLARRLCLEGAPPLAVILQNPFNNVLSVMDYSKMAIPYRFLPWYMPFFKRAVISTGTSFSNDINIADVTSPVLIIHAEDDRVVPIALGYKLKEAADRAESRKAVITEMEVLNHCGHNNAHLDPKFAQIVRKFFASVLEGYRHQRSL